MARIGVVGIDQVVRDLNRVDKQFENTGKSASSGFKRVGDGAQQYLGGALIAATAAGTAALVGFGASSVKVASEYESTLNRFSSVAGSAIEDAGMSISEFNELALDMGAKTQFSAGQAADAMVELAKGGLSPATIAAGGLKGALDLAAAGELGLGEAAGITAKQLGIWGDQGITAADVANQLAQAANASTVDVDELALGLANVGGSAKVAGLDFREMNQTMALIAPGFSSAADAGTSFKALLANLAPETARQSDAFETLNLLTAEGTSKFFDLNGQFVGMEQATRLLAEGTKDLSEEQKIMALNAAFGSDAIRVAALLADQGAEGYRAMGVAMDGAGTAAQQAAERNKGLGFAVESLKGSLETIQIVVGSAVIPVLTDFVEDVLIPGANNALAFAQAVTSADDPMRELVTRIDNALPGFKGTVTVVGATADIISDNLVPAVYALSAGTTVYAVGSLPKMVTGLGVATKALLAHGVAATTALGPLGILAAGAALAVGGLVKSHRDGEQRIQDMTKAVQDEIVVLQDAQKALDALQSSQAGSSKGAEKNIADLERLKQAHTDVTAKLEEYKFALKGADPAALEKATAPYVQQQRDLEGEIGRVTDRMRMQAQAQASLDAGLKGSTGTWSAYNGGVQDVSKALTAMAENTQIAVTLTADEIAKLEDAITKAAGEGTSALDGWVSATVSFQSELASTSAEHWATLADLHKEWADATTDQERDAIQERIDAENTGFATSQQNAAIAYAQQAAAQRAHLGEMLIETVNSWVIMGQVPAERAAEMNQALATEYGVAASNSQLMFEQMVGHLADWRDNAAISSSSVIGDLQTAGNTAVTTQQQMDALTGEYTATLIQNFLEGKIDADELTDALGRVPREVQVMIQTNADAVAASVDAAGSALARLQQRAANATTVRIHAEIDGPIEAHSPSPMELSLARTADLIRAMPTLRLRAEGSADLRAALDLPSQRLTGGYADEPVSLNGKVRTSVENVEAHLRKLITSLQNTSGKVKSILGQFIPDNAIAFAGEQGGDLGATVAVRIVGGFVDQHPMEQIADKVKTMLGQVIPADAVPFAGELGEDLGAAMAVGAAKKLKTVLGQMIPGAIADVSKALQSDKNRSDEAKAGKSGNLGDFVTAGSGRLGDAAAVPGDFFTQAPEIAGSEGKLTGMAFVEAYQESLIDLRLDSIDSVTDYFADIRSDGVRPALLAMKDQLYFGGLTAVDALGDALVADLTGIEGAGRAAGEAYMRGFNAAMGGVNAPEFRGGRGGFSILGEKQNRGI